MKKLQMTVCAMSLAAAMSASATITYSGTQLQSTTSGGALTYSASGGTSTASYVAASGPTPAYADLFLQNGTDVSIGTVNVVGTLNTLIAAGGVSGDSSMTFDLLAMTGNGTQTGGNYLLSAQWEITLINPGDSSQVTWLSVSDQGLGGNVFDKGTGSSYFQNTGNTNPNQTDTWANLAKTEGAWNVASVSVEIGSWGNQGNSGTFEAKIDSITVPGTQTQTQVSSVPEPSTVVAGALMLLPFGIGAIRSLRKDRRA